MPATGASLNRLNVAADPFLTGNAVMTAANAAGTGGPVKKQTAPPRVREVVKAAVLPIPIFILVSASYAFLWSIAMWVPVVITLVSIIVTIDVGLQNHVFGHAHLNKAAKKDNEDKWLQCLTSLMATVLGVLTGIYAHEAYVLTFYAVAFGSEYSNVLASTPAVAFADAGKLHFAPSSTVATDMALGYRDKHTFCAAPILDASSNQKRSVGFWAIGWDCCSARGDFECGKAGSAHARGGIKAPRDGLLDQSHSAFLRAIRQAAAVYNLHVQEDAVLLHWVQDPAKVQSESLLKALGVIGIGVGIFVLLVIVMVVAQLATGSVNPDD